MHGIWNVTDQVPNEIRLLICIYYFFYNSNTPTDHTGSASEEIKSDENQFYIYFLAGA